MSDTGLETPEWPGDMIQSITPQLRIHLMNREVLIRVSLMNPYIEHSGVGVVRRSGGGVGGAAHY